MVQLSSMISFKNIENSIDKLTIAAWVWDADRNRIIAANGHAVKFWQELSVLDLIDTLFGEFHPMSLQFAKAAGRIVDDAETIDQTIDFTSIALAEKIDCQFTKLEINPNDADSERQIILVNIAPAKVLAATDAHGTGLIIQNDDVIAKMLENAPAALALFDKHGKFCFANLQCQQIFSKSSEEFIPPVGLSDWFSADDAKPDDAKNIVKNLIEKCFHYKIANISAKLDTAFGSRTHSVVAKSFAIKPFHDGEAYVLIYLRDVADERHYEQILVERIAKLEQLTQLGSDFYFILDEDMDFVQLGGDFEPLTGHSASEILGENWHSIAARFELDPDGIASEYFGEQKSFDNLAITWPVKDSASGISLIWRGRPIFEMQNGNSVFTGNLVTAFENIQNISGGGLSADTEIHSFSDHVELMADDEDIDDDIIIDDIVNDDIELDDFDAAQEVAALAELDGVETADIDEIIPEATTSQTTDIELSALETNLSDVEAVNFTSIGDALSEDDDKPQEVETPEQTTAEPEKNEKTRDPVSLVIENNLSDDSGASVEDVISRSDDVIAEINALLGETSSPTTKAQHQSKAPSQPLAVEEPKISQLADNVVPAFGATVEDIEKFGRTEVDMFKLVLDQTPVMAAITSLPSEEAMFTLFANKELLHNLGMIDDKDQEIASDEYSNILSVESMEILNQLKDEFIEKPLDQEISFLVKSRKHYFNAKINKIDWQEHKALQFILSPKIILDNLSHTHMAPKTEVEQALLVEKTNPAETDSNVLQFVLDGQAFINRDLIILSTNIYLNNILGMNEGDLIGKPIGNIMAETDYNGFQDYAHSVLVDDHKNLSQDGIELELINKTGENHTVFLHIQRLTAPEAENYPSDILVNIRDISIWKRRELNLRDAKDKAEQENVQKSGFLARISHELRTPLNAIIGFSEVMSDEKFGPLENTRYKGYANDINESGEHLLSLINDLLDLSKVEAGKVELDFKAMNLEPLILQSVQLMQPMADKKRIIIRTSISSKLPQIIADMRSIRQIVLNLLSNSIKYSNSGSQVIISTLLDDDGKVIIRVRDTGIGMNENQLEAALEPFKTLNMSTLVDRQGTGLGLPLTKALAEANRAEFSIESAVDAGTLVQITFPTTRVLTV